MDIIQYNGVHKFVGVLDNPLSLRNKVKEVNWKALLNSTKPLDDLKDQESELQCQNEEDQAIIQDENASPSDKEAAEGRATERNEELESLQTQIAERERARPLLERIKEIFKKWLTDLKI